MSAASIVRTSAFAALAAAATLAPARAGDAIGLARVARDLGYRYAYLPLENAVSLTRPGTVIVVRPGDAFFSVNARREPVYGMVPAYRDADVVVSRAFESEIRAYAPRARVPVIDERDARADGGPVVTTPARAEAGNVTGVRAFYDRSESAIVVVGNATPGSRVSLVLRANLSADLPVVTLDGADTFADAGGRFRTSLDGAPDRFTYSRFFVEASGPSDGAPAVVEVTNRAQTSADRTAADRPFDK